mgnify:CR=1 FL=1
MNNAKALPPPSGSNPNGMPSEHDDSFDPDALWQTLKRGKWTILITCVLVAGLVMAYTFTRAPVYEASTLASVDEAPPPTQAQVITLNNERDLTGEVGVLEHSGELARRVLRTLSTVADTSEAQFPLVEPTEDGNSVDIYAASKQVHRMMQFTAVPERSMIRITASSESPAEAAALANIYAREYRNFSRDMARASVSAARNFLENQLEKRRDDIRAIEAQWKSFAESNAVVTEGEDGQRVAQEYVELQTKRDGLQFQLEQEQRVLSSLKAQLDEAQPSLRQSVLREQRAQSLRTQIQSLEEKIASLKTEAEQYYIVNPELRGSEDRVPELADLQKRIEGFEERKVELTEELVVVSQNNAQAPETGGAIGKMGTLRQRIDEQEHVIGQLNAQIEGLNQRIARHEERIDGIPNQRIQREQIERRLRQAEEFHNDIAMELQRTIIAEESELGYVQVMRTAEAPSIPVRPNKTLNTLLGLLLGLGMGIGVAFLRQSMNWQLQDPRDLPSHGYKLLGVIPRMDQEIRAAFDGNQTIDVEGKALSTRLMPLLNPWSPITENYRLLRTNLQFVGPQNGTDDQDDVPQVMMVTSPEPGDGKTTTAVNLAITLALSGRQVLLIDGDMRRSNVHKLLDIDRSPGLAEMLMGTHTGSIVQHTFLNGLYVVPAGTPESPPTELLDSDQMRALINLGRSRCDAIIIDSPPVLAASDPLVLGGMCDGTLVVAAAGKTDLRALQQVRETLDGVDINVEGVVFNRYDVTTNQTAYRYGYDYSYDYRPAA